MITVQGNFLTARELIRQANRQGQVIEIRLDLLESLGDAFLLRSFCDLPVIFALRKKSQGGKFKGDERKREQKILDLLSCGPEYLDLEYDSCPPFFHEVLRNFPKTKIICSYHDFEKTPEHLESILMKMKNRPAAAYKIATFARSSLDSLRMLTLVQTQRCVAGMCMGKHGIITRVLAPIVGSMFTYTTIDTPLIPGQVPIDVLEKTYHFSRLGKHTAICALIGDPIAESQGHLFHNLTYRILALDAVYVKFVIRPTEVPEFFRLIRSLPFRGFSITMPLKEVVWSFLDRLDASTRSIGAVNTLVWQQGKWKGVNTDGIGGLDALEAKEKIKGKRIVILGAGGTARALTFESISRGGKVWIANRSEEKARQLAAQFGCKTTSFKKWHHLPFDILINTTPIGMESSDSKIIISSHLIPKHATVFDAVARLEQTDLLYQAQSKGCKTICGYDMFFRQADRQIAIWFNRSVDFTSHDQKAVLNQVLQRFS